MALKISSSVKSLFISSFISFASPSLIKRLGTFWLLWLEDLNWFLKNWWKMFGISFGSWVIFPPGCNTDDFVDFFLWFVFLWKYLVLGPPSLSRCNLDLWAHHNSSWWRRLSISLWICLTMPLFVILLSLCWATLRSSWRYLIFFPMLLKLFLPYSPRIL